MSAEQYLPGNSDYEDSENFAEDEKIWESYPQFESIRSAMLSIAREQRIQNILMLLQNHSDQVSDDKRKELGRQVLAGLGVIEQADI